MKKQASLKRSVKRILLFRLSLVALGVAVFFAALSLYHSRNMITDAVVQASTIQINVIRGRLQELMNRPGENMQAALQDAVNYPPDSRLHLKEGEFVFALLHSGNRESIGSYEHSSYPALPQIKKYLETAAKHYPAYGQIDHKSVTIAGRPYLDIHSKLTEGKGKSDIYLRAIFALSDGTIQSVRRQALQIIFYVVGLVIITALLLYPVIVHLMNRLADYSTGLLTAQLETMEALGAAIAKRDSDTNIHNYRVTIYAVYIGEKLAMDELQMQCLIKGAFLHDVGKIGIRDNILLNKAKLDAREFEIMKKHVQYGLEIIKESSWLEGAADVVGGHHEKFNGSGYPQGLQGDTIPLNARIFAIVDVFDALTSKRPYKEPFSFEQTMRIMEEGRASHFDPALLTIFTEMAESLYKDYSGREDSGLKMKLEEITDRYFKSGLDTLLY